MINIAVDCRKIRDGGIGTYLDNLLECWSKGDSDAQFILFHYPQHRDCFGYMNDSTRFVEHDYKKYSIKELYSFKKPLIENKADLFFTPHYTLPFNLPCKSVAVIHDLIHLKFPVKKNIIGRLYARNIIKHALKKADSVISVSESTRKDITAFFPKNSSRVEVIPCGVNREVFRPLPEDEIKQFRRAKSLPEKYIFYAGALKKHKNPEALLKLASYFKMSIVICSGDEGLFNKYQLGNPAAGGYLILRKAVNFEEMAHYYNASELLVFPSFYEGFGLPPLEAMACGIPVVCSNAASLPEVVGEAALSFSPYDEDEMIKSVEAALTDKNMRDSLVQKGLKRTEKFGWNKSAVKVFDNFKRIIQG
jgi:glycosyltransferase involved in cell wall biosynthesis